MSEWYNALYDDDPEKSDITYDAENMTFDIYVKNNDFGNVYVTVKVKDIIEILNKYSLFIFS
jgi:hypothetical protein